MAKPNDPKPKPKDVTKKRIVGIGKSGDNLKTGGVAGEAWGPRKPRKPKSKTTRGKK